MTTKDKTLDYDSIGSGGLLEIAEGEGYKIESDDDSICEARSCQNYDADEEGAYDYLIQMGYTIINY